MTGKTANPSLSQHPFESSPLLGTRQQTQSLGHLARELEQENRMVLDGRRDMDSLSESAEDASARTSLPLPKNRHLHMNRSMSAVVKQRSRYYIPVLDWLPNYRWTDVGGDLVGGITVACLIIPQSMSYASGLAQLPPIAGLYSVVIPGLIYSLLGTCRQLSVGPEAALSLLVGQVVTQLTLSDPHTIPDNPEKVAIAIAIVITLQVGLITFLLGICRLGFLDVVLSRPLLRGFITAVGIIILIEQLVPMLGLNYLLHNAHTQTPINKLVFLVKHISFTNRYTAIMSAVSLSCLIGAKITKRRFGAQVKALKYVPEIFIIVVLATFITAKFRLDEKGVLILGELEGGRGIPFDNPFKPRHLKYFKATFPTAVVIAVVGYVDSIVAAKENSARFGYAISPNRELVALGTANFFSSFLGVTGAVPAFGAITRSRLNATVGGRSQMASLFTSSIVIITALFLLPYFHFLPKAVLASIITLVVYAILAEAPHDLKFYWKVRAWTDFLQACMTFILTLFLSVEIGLVASVCFSLILVIRKSTQARIKILGRLKDSDQWIPVDEHPDEDVEEDIPGVLVVRIRENLNFANTGQLKERLRRLEIYGAGKFHPSDAPKRDGATAVVFHMNDVEDIDASALQIFSELAQSYKDRGVGLYFVHMRKSQLDAFVNIGIHDIIGLNHFLPDLRSAINAIGRENSGLQEQQPSSSLPASVGRASGKPPSARLSYMRSQLPRELRAGDSSEVSSLSDGKNANGQRGYDSV
ncbi:hypothetical protein NliqN6_0288 [Naganishia liquefaciens]|uniref:STAS domain-containing protein n=1 Tax=Naganishia liquefaciens TaxID=104408 RepID=A0A8H3TNB9_9TREE|nr:hypothetical protein NliqN6_0288 [Naganishia liquefaciens]